jgi:hypothetical protein
MSYTFHGSASDWQAQGRRFTCPSDFTPIDQETRTHVSTKVMCHHLGRKEQTARGWACHEDGPLRPIRVNGRLAWPVADIRRILGVTSKVGG